MNGPGAHPFDSGIIRWHNTGHFKLWELFLKGLSHPKKRATSPDGSHPAIDPTIHLFQYFFACVFPVSPGVINIAQLIGPPV